MQPEEIESRGASFDAQRLRGFGPIGLLAALAILLAGNLDVSGIPIFPVGALLALAWVRLSGTPWPELGFVRPRNWFLTIVLGVLLGAGLKLLLKSIVMPLLGAPETNAAFQFLRGNVELLPLAVWGMFLAGVTEEIVFRGFLFERLRTLLGAGRVAAVAIVVLGALVFALVHLAGQGIWGAAQAVIVGLVFGAVFQRARQIWLLMIAHTSFDLTALALIWFGVEEEAAKAVLG
jgi:membrane protease YdiL (CAAX protease family)